MATRDQNAKADGEHWLFGLMIDEEIQWGAIRATKRGYVGDLHLGSFGRMGNSTDNPFDLPRHLETCLKALKRQRRNT